MDPLKVKREDVKTLVVSLSEEKSLSDSLNRLNNLSKDELYELILEGFRQNLAPKIEKIQNQPPNTKNKSDGGKISNKQIESFYKNLEDINPRYKISILI